MTSEATINTAALYEAPDEFKDYTVMDVAVYEAQRAADEADEMLRSACVSVQHEMERAIAAVDAHMNVNSLGAVQGRGLDVDRWCALRYERHMHLTHMKALAMKVRAAIAGEVAADRRTIKARLGEPRPAWEASK